MQVLVPFKDTIILIQELFDIKISHETMYLLISLKPFMEVLDLGENTLRTTGISHYTEECRKLNTSASRFESNALCS
jgi:hypothetical protein